MSNIKSNIAKELKISLKRRFKEVRQVLNMNQKQFADELKLTQSNVSKIEMLDNDRGVPEKSILLLEKLYNINPTWLETGEGQMFKDTSELASQPNQKPDMTNESLKDRMIENLLDQVKKLEEELQQYKASTPKSKEAS